MKYSHILSEVMATPWAIRPEKLNAIMAFLRLKSEGINLTADDVALVKQQPREPYLLEASGEMEAEGRVTPLYFVRVGTDYYLRKGPYR